MTQPRQTIIFSKVPMDQEQMKRLAEVFAHPGFSLLRAIIGAHASEEQVKAMNSGLYVDFSEDAKLDTKTAMVKAIDYAKSLDILDEIAARQEEWFTARLETRP